MPGIEMLRSFGVGGGGMGCVPRAMPRAGLSHPFGVNIQADARLVALKGRNKPAQGTALGEIECANWHSHVRFRTDRSMNQPHPTLMVPSFVWLVSGAGGNLP
jgi:hypothetical protein